MSAERIVPSTPNAALDTSSLSSKSSSLPLWDRLSAWASENKAVVYTIAGVAVVVTGAGIVYYRSDSRIGNHTVGAEVDSKKRASKKERRKAKKEKDKEQAQPSPRAPEQGGQPG